MAPVTAYTVRAKRAGKYWELHIDGVGVTQSRNLTTDADEMIRSYVHMMKDVPAASVAFTILPDIGGDLGAEAVAARKAAEAAERAVKDSAARNRSVARALLAAGITGRDAAAILGVTPQRVSQLLGKGAKEVSAH